MKATEPKIDEKKKKVAFGAAGISIFLHLGLFVLIGSVVVVEFAVPRSPMTGELSPVMDTADATPDEPEAANEPEATDTPSDAAPAAAESAPIDMSVSSTDVLTVASPVTSFQMPVMGGVGGTGTAAAAGSGVGGGKGGRPGKINNPFGGSERMGNDLEGILYDLKQTKTGKPSGMDPNKYLNVITEFNKKDWNPQVLEEFYQVKKPLYTSLIYMPVMTAGVAPKAFNVEKEVQPSMWVVLYKGNFEAPPGGGSFRLAGYADDVLLVRMNGRVVLDGSIMSSRLGGKNTMVKTAGQEFNAAHKMGNGTLAYTDWMKFEGGEKGKLEILIGERPGGQFCAFLLVEEKGKEYKKDANGRPILPLFRTTDASPASGSDYDKDGPIFGAN